MIELAVEWQEECGICGRRWEGVDGLGKGIGIHWWIVWRG